MNWISSAESAEAPNNPFFVYFAPGATHAPHHVPKEWADKYKGKFDAGWDALRDETFARQKEARRDPGRTPGSLRGNKELPTWESMPDDFKPFLRPPDGSLRRLSWSTPTTTLVAFSMG